MNEKSNFRLLAIVLLFLSLCGMFFPDSWWGVHYISFLPPALAWSIIVISSVLIIFPKRIKAPNSLLDLLFDEDNRLKKSTLFIIAGGLGLLFYSYPIAFDDYGDAFQYRPRGEERLIKIPPNYFNDLFSFDLMPSAGRKTVLLLYGLLTHYFGASYLQIFTTMGILFGVTYVFVWLYFIQLYVSSRKWQLLLAVIGLFAPFTQVFYGHLETYALVFLALTTWFIGLLIYLKENSARLLWILLFGALICIKLHPFNVLLLPAWAMVYLHTRMDSKAWVQKLLTWKGILLRLFLPLFVLWLYVYFIALGDASDSRNLDNDRAIDHLFLPIFSPEAPLNRYNLFSINHLLDYLNAILTWSLPAFMILLSTIGAYRKQINWNSPALLIVGSTILMFAGVLFVINPLVSMPMDWDLFSFPAPLLIILVVVLVSEIKIEEALDRLIAPAYGLLLLAIPFFAVNASEKMLSERLQTVGKHVYKTYYLHSNRIIINGLSLLKDDEAYIDRKKEILSELSTYAIPGSDPMYGNLLMDNGFYYLRIAGDYTKALDIFKQAEYYNPESDEIQSFLEETKSKISGVPMVEQNGDPFVQLEREGLVLLRQKGEFRKAVEFFENALLEYPDNKILHLYLMEGHFMLKEFAAAYGYALKLVEQKFPDEKKAYLIAIHCGLEAGKYNDVKELSDTYLLTFSDDKRIQEVNRRLTENDQVNELRNLFAN